MPASAGGERGNRVGQECVFPELEEPRKGSAWRQVEYRDDSLQRERDGKFKSEGFFRHPPNNGAAQRYIAKD